MADTRRKNVYYSAQLLWGNDVMINDWKDFLLDAGAEFNDRGVVHYGNLRRELSVAITGNVFADLSHYGLISVHGDDAETFLQGQLTNDVGKVDEQHSQLSGICNPKGRLIASFRVFRRADSYYLCLPVDIIEPVISRLRMNSTNCWLTCRTRKHLSRVSFSGWRKWYLLTKIISKQRANAMRPGVQSGPSRICTISGFDNGMYF